MENDTFAQYVNYRLSIWAEWTLRYITPALGYPTKALEAKLKEQGGLLIRDTQKRRPPENSEAEEMEQIIQQLFRQNQRLAHVLHEDYLTQGTGRDKARRLHLSYTQYRVSLDMAKQWIAGRLSGK